MAATRIVLLVAMIALSTGEREHKVHNIVLYPEKHSWCKTTKIEQIVTMPGYEPMKIENNVCVGACYSYSIPRTQPAEPGELIGPYCDSCQPANSKCYHVTLKADNKNAGPATFKKRVQIITNCTCRSCSKTQETDCEVLEEKTAELPSGLFSVLFGNFTANATKQDDVPELLNIEQKNPNTSTPNLEPLNEDVNQVLRKKLIQSLTNSDLKKDDLIKQLIVALEDGKNKFTNDHLLSLFTSTSTELDLEKIKEILKGVKEQRELLEKHRNFGIGIEENLKTFNLKSFGLDPYKSHHIELVDTNVIVNPERKHHHYIGEVQNVGLTSGLLNKGPHGSLVVVPQQVKVEQKLQLTQIKPNEEGVIINYK